jgi:BirA family biotin operon repressor/biotin-[acetyl-CoA-carboxylase] ligase
MIDKYNENTFNKNNYEFFHKETTSSTMDDVKNFIKNKKKNCIYLSDKQINGKGQRGNFWHSPLGNVYCSISFENFLHIKDHFLFSVLVALTVKKSLEIFNAKNIFFKWPNDIFFKKKKFGGIISELIKVNSKSYVIVGFGINIESSPKLSNYKTTFAKHFSDIKSKEDFLLVFFKQLFFKLSELQEGRKKYLMNEFSKSLLLFNEKILIINKNKEKNEGVFRGINDDGSLRLEKNGDIKNIYNGSIQI